MELPSLSADASRVQGGEGTGRHRWSILEMLIGRTITSSYAGDELNFVSLRIGSAMKQVLKCFAPIMDEPESTTNET